VAIAIATSLAISDVGSDCGGNWSSGEGMAFFSLQSQFNGAEDTAQCYMTGESDMVSGADFTVIAQYNDTEHEASLQLLANTDESQLHLNAETVYVGKWQNGLSVTRDGAVVVNNAGDAAVDFRVYGDTDTSLLLCDASADKVGIGDSAPGEKLDVAGNINATGVIKIDDVQVVSNRVVDARCDDAINSGDATTDGVIDALRDAMIAHGLIAAA
jgi:hypothetical protein